MSDVLSAVMSQYDDNSKAAKKKVKITDEERLKRYFSANLPKNKNDGQKVFRILPPKNGKSPFVEVWLHEIKMEEDWKKLYCPKKNKTGECPLCDIEHEASKGTEKADKDLASSYRARKFYVVKGIDRDKEEDGPKFWRFRHNSKKQGTLDKIIPVFSNKGDITNAENGRDLIITLGKDENGYSKVTSIMPEDAGPLSQDKELAQSWIEEGNTWEDVYSKSSFEYLEIVAQGGVPYWDKEAEKYISKTEWEAKNTNDTHIESMNDDGETTVVIGGKKEQPKEDEKKTPIENKTVTTPPAKTAPKTAPKVATKPAPAKEEVDEANDDADVEMSDLPF